MVVRWNAVRAATVLLRRDRLVKVRMLCHSPRSPLSESFRDPHDPFPVVLFMIVITVRGGNLL